MKKKRLTCSTTGITVDLPFPDGMSIHVCVYLTTLLGYLKSNLSQDRLESWTLMSTGMATSCAQMLLLCAAKKNNGVLVTERDDRCQLRARLQFVNQAARWYYLMVLWVFWSSDFWFKGLTQTWEKRVEAPGRGGLQGRLICSMRPIWVHRESANINYPRPTSYCHDVESFCFLVVISLVRTCVVLIVKSSSKCRVSLRSLPLKDLRRILALSH
jgi:hypothetical protein